MKKILSQVGVVSTCMLFSAIHSQVKAQTRIVTGQVNSQGRPLSGVTVSIDGTNQVTTTSKTGAFTLQINSENAILIFRHPEYTDLKISTLGKTTFTVSLSEKIKTIEEVVLNAGYYNVKARESTGSISKVSAKEIENQPVNNVLAAVQGKMSGVSITNNTGNAGGGFDVAIRGQNSVRFDGNAPLIIVNGIPLNTNSNSVLGLSTGALSKGEASPLNAINPNDIESFEVLKDADATAIYGSRGANGVVLITTKQGSSKDLTAELRLSTSVSKASRFIELASTAQYRKLREDAYRLDGITSYPTNAYDLNGKWDNTRETDWYKTFIGKNFLTQQQELSVSGGNAQNKLRVSLFNDQRGTVYGNDFDYKRSGFTLNSSFQAKNSRLKIAPSVFYTLENNRLAVADLTRQSFIAPNAPMLLKPDGNLNWENNTFTNPLAQLENKYTAKTNTFSSSVLTEYTFLPEFTFRVNAGYTQTLVEEFKTSPSTQYNPANGATAHFSSITVGDTRHGNWIVEPQLNWEKRWSVHKVSGIIGSTLEERKNNILSIQGSDFSSNELLYNLSNAKVQKVATDTETRYRYQAFYGRINYSGKDRYILNLTARRDGSSRFGPNNRFANFGAVGAAWIFSKENFLKESPWLNYGKLRASFGLTGSDQIGDYQYLNTYTTSTVTYDGVVTLYPSRLYNPDFTWEKTTKAEAAFELGLFREVINFTAAWYRNRSSNQLVGAPLAATTGFTSMQQNFPATVQNTGLELEMNASVIKRKNIKWNMSGNISFPSSKLLEFPNIETSSYANTYVVGQSLNIRKVYEYAGINKTTGVYQFTDFNGDGKITLDDRKKTADFGIQFYGGFGNSFQYKNLSLQFQWQFVKQRQLDTLYSLAASGSMANVTTYMLDYWTPENPDAKYQRPTSGTNSAVLKAFTDYRNSDAAIVDASFIRLNNLQLNWQLPFPYVGNSHLVLGITGQNLITLTKFKGLDPEVHGIYLPILKTYSLSATLKF